MFVSGQLNIKEERLAPLRNRVFCEKSDDEQNWCYIRCGQRQGRSRKHCPLAFLIRKFHHWVIMFTKDEITAIASVLSAFVAGGVAIIAWQQWLINNRKSRFELYDKRMPVYLALMSLLAKIGQESNINNEELFSFVQKTRESHFLFGEDIHQYLDAIYKASIDVQYRSKRLHDPTMNLPIGEERTKIAQEQGTQLKWFTAQWEVARKKFARYMRLS